MVVSSHRPQTKVYTPALRRVDHIQVEQANRIVSETGNDQFSMAYIQSVSTLHQPETSHFDFLAHHTEPLHLPGTDVDHALRMASPDRPVFIASSTAPFPEHEHIMDDDQRPLHHKSTLVISMNEHHANFGEDTVIYEYLAPLNQSILSIGKANQSRDSGISLNSSQVQEQATMFHSPFNEQARENLVEEPDYRYHRQEQPRITSNQVPRSPSPDDRPTYSTTNQLVNIDSTAQNAHFIYDEPIRVAHDTDEPIYCEIPDAFMDERRPETARYKDEVQRYLETVTYPEPMLPYDESNRNSLS